MAMTIPTIPSSLPAGYVVTANDMNNLGAACTFLMTRPIARVHDAAGTQTIGTSVVAVQFNTKDFDTDGMWSSGANTRLTVQTPGFYKVEYWIDLMGSSSSTNADTYVQVTSGSNNPAGAGIIQPCWGGHATAGVAASTRSGAHSAGILPLYMYSLDYVEIYALCTTATPLSTSIPSFLTMELVSI